MGIFTISCQTCAARLVVQNESAIGQVLACPKCGSMVEVHPPQGWESTETQETDSANTTAGQAAPRIDTSGANSPSKPPSKPPANEPVLPTDQWTSDSVKQRRKAIGMIAGIVAIAAVVLASIGFLISQNSKKDNLADKGSSDQQNQSDENQENEETSNDDGNEDNQDSTSENDSDNEQTTNLEDDSSDNTDASTTGDEQGLDAETNGNAQANTDPDDVDTTSDTNLTSNENDNEQTPFEIDSDRNLTIDNVPQEESMLDSLNEVGPLIFEELPLSADEINDVRTDLEDEAVGIGKVFIPRPDPLTASLDAALADTISGLKYENVSLLEFIRFFNQMTAIPIGLDIVAIAEGRMDPSATVSVDETDIPAVELLSKVLGSLNLHYEILGENETRVVLVTAPNEMTKVTYELPSPLVADEATLNHMVDAIQVVISAKSWNINGGEGSIEIEGDKLVVDHTSSVHARVTRLMNLFAAAKTLKENPKDAQAQETCRSVYSRSRPLLTSDGSFKLLQRQPIGSVLNRVHRDDGLAVIVDWVTIIPMGWNQRTEIPWPSKDNDLESTVRDVAQSMTLNCMAIGEETMVITSRNNVKYMPLIEVYPVGHLFNDRLNETNVFDLFRTSIARAIPPQSETYVYYDERYKCIVAALPEFLQIRAQSIVEQLEQVQQANAGS